LGGLRPQRLQDLREELQQVLAVERPVEGELQVVAGQVPVTDHATS
jgi:hypothetical protein